MMPLILRISINHLPRLRRDNRTPIPISHANPHPLHPLPGNLRLNGRNIPPGPTLILPIAKRKLPPRRRKPTQMINRQTPRPRRSTPCPLRVLVKRDIPRLAGAKDKAQRGVAVPPVHFVVRADLVPDRDCPGLRVGAREARDVFVAVGFGGTDGYYVAAPGDADVAVVFEVCAGWLGAAAEAGECKVSVLRDGSPVEVGWYWGFVGV